MIEVDRYGLCETLLNARNKIPFEISNLFKLYELLHCHAENIRSDILL